MSSFFPNIVEIVLKSPLMVQFWFPTRSLGNWREFKKRMFWGIDYEPYTLVIIPLIIVPITWQLCFINLAMVMKLYKVIFVISHRISRPHASQYVSICTTSQFLQTISTYLYQTLFGALRFLHKQHHQFFHATVLLKIFNFPPDIKPTNVPCYDIHWVTFTERKQLDPQVHPNSQILPWFN